MERALLCFQIVVYLCLGVLPGAARCDSAHNERGAAHGRAPAPPNAPRSSAGPGGSTGRLPAHSRHSLSLASVAINISNDALLKKKRKEEEEKEVTPVISMAPFIRYLQTRQRHQCPRCHTGVIAAACGHVGLWGGVRGPQPLQRITAWFGLEGLRDHPVPSPEPWAGTPPARDGLCLPLGPFPRSVML